MHKITKGLKKKKKGKKSKHKDDELFKPEELEAYRKAHQDTSTGSGAENEEWKKFNALTSGIDDVLHKTQEELSRIKETSFFQRVPPPSEVKREEVKRAAEQERVELEESKPQQPDPTQLGIVEISESESEGADEDEDDIFDTAYIDAIATGEVKLAYIPDSPTEDAGDDPFDTSYAEKAILGPAVAKKGKKLVPIGAAVEVLTGRVQLPTCSTPRPASSRRQILKERDLLLGSFDDNANSIAECIKDSPIEIRKTLLDEDAPPDLANEPIDLSKSLYIPPPSVAPSPNSDSVQADEESEDDEFAQLAAENLSKEPVNKIETLPNTIPEISEIQIEENWDPFADQKFTLQNEQVEDIDVCLEDEDPFDTTFAENILPGKAELKQIESEILNAQVEFEVKPQQEKILNILKKLSISEEDRIPETSLNVLRQKHRDLLGGSNTDLSSLNRPLTPAAQIDENYIEYCDPFDTSIVETVKKPGQTELKFLEQELLSDITKQSDLSDDDFDPRAEETPSNKERSVSRPDVLNFSSSKSVCFDTTNLSEKNCLGVDTGSVSKIAKPPTPFYVRKNSVPGSSENDISPDPDIFETEEDFDPFDTSIANNFTSS